MIISSLLVGAGIGLVASKLGIKTEVIVGAGMLGALVTGGLTLPLGVGILGAAVVTGIKDLIDNTKDFTSNNIFNNKNKSEDEIELEEIEKLFNNYTSTPSYNNSSSNTNSILITAAPTNTNQTDTTNTVKKEVRGALISNLTSLILLAPAVILISTISGLSSFILPISTIGLIVGGYKALTKGTLTENVKNIIGVGIVGILATGAILNVSSGGTFLYFLSLITIPSLLLKDKISNNKVNNTKTSIYNLKDNFMYGSSGSSVPVVGGALTLLLTVINSSGLDMLGTLVNNDYSILLDPYRLSIMSVVTIITAISSGYFYNKIKTDTNTNNKLGATLTTLLGIGTLGTMLITCNPLIVITTTILGLITKKLLNKNTNTISIGILLLVGMLTSAI